MSRILIIAATHLEIAPALKHLGILSKSTGRLLRGKNKKVKVLITGVGMVNTAFHMGRTAIKSTDVLIHAGIAGAFDPSIALGEVVCVTQDVLSEMGAEDGPSFLTYPQLGLGGLHHYTSKLPSSNTLRTLKKVKGVTVNKVHGRTQSIAELKRYYKADVESMEGAAFLMAASESQCKAIAIRAVSNYVERRNKSKWKIPLAVSELNKVLVALIEELKK